MPADSLSRVRRVSRRRVSVAQEFRAAIHQAREDGHSLRAIAEAAGLSHVRVLKILRGE